MTELLREFSQEVVSERLIKSCARGIDINIEGLRPRNTLQLDGEAGHSDAMADMLSGLHAVSIA